MDFDFDFDFSGIIIPVLIMWIVVSLIVWAMPVYYKDLAATLPIYMRVILTIVLLPIIYVIFSIIGSRD